MSRVLIVEDDASIRTALAVNLQARGYETDVATSGEEGLQLAARAHPDAVILDLGLPAMDGRDVISRLRGWTSVPIVVVSGRDAEAVKADAFDRGADDYVTKPFDIEDLFARLRAAMRRSVPPDGSVLVATPDFRLDFVERRARVHGASVRLTPTQWLVIDLLVRHRGRLVTSEQLVHDVWGDDHGDGTNSVRTAMAQIRRILEPDPQRPRYFVSDPDGYRFTLPCSADA